MQPVQDLTVEDRVSRTQCPIPEDADPQELGTWVPRLSPGCGRCPPRDVASDQRTSGCTRLVIDRLPPRLQPAAGLDAALYDAYGLANFDHVHAAESIRVSSSSAVFQSDPMHWSTCRRNADEQFRAITAFTRIGVQRTPRNHRGSFPS
jgi:hypothetical protein